MTLDDIVEMIRTRYGDLAAEAAHGSEQDEVAARREEL
jgi:hypothetical protein